VRFPRDPFDALLARMRAFSCFAVAIGHPDFPSGWHEIQTYWA